MYQEGRVLIGENCPIEHQVSDITELGQGLVTSDCYGESDGGVGKLEIFATFATTSVDEDDPGYRVVETESLIVPNGSPIAQIAREIEADTSGDSVHLLGEELRRAVMNCACDHQDECPVLGSIGLLTAMESALEKKNRSS